MPIISTLGGEVRDLDPDKLSPSDVAQICIMAQMRLNQMLTHGQPLSDTEEKTGKILDEIDTILRTVQAPDVQTRWKPEALAHIIVGRLAELEDEAYHIFLASIEELEHDNPLRSLAEAYRLALEQKQQGQIPGAMVLGDPRTASKTLTFVNKAEPEPGHKNEMLE